MREIVNLLSKITLLYKLSNIVSFTLILAASLTVYIDLSKYGIINGITYLNTFVYVAYTYNLIIFAVFLTILVYKYKYYALPIFLISYCIWDGLGILKNIIDVQPHLIPSETASFFSNIHWTFVLYLPYYKFQAIFFATICIAFILFREKKLSFKLNNKSAILFYFLLYSGTPTTILNMAIPFAIVNPIATLILCYFSIKPYNKDSKLYHNIVLDPDV